MRIKKVMCAILASTMMLGMAACGNDKGKGTSKKSPSSESEIMAENELETAKELQNISIFQKDDSFKISGIKGAIAEYKTTNDNIYLSTNVGPSMATDTDSSDSITVAGVPITGETTSCLYKVPATGGEAELIYDGSDNKGHIIDTIICGADDKVYFITSSTSDFEDITISEVSDGNVKTMGDASVFLGDDDLGFGGLVVDKNGNFVTNINRNTIQIFDHNLKATNKCQVNGTVDELLQDASGDIAIKVYNDDCGLEIKKIDTANGKIADGCDIGTLNADSFFNGTDGYDLYYSTDSTLYGYKYEGNESTEIFDFNLSGINPSQTCQYNIVDANTFMLRELSDNYEMKPDISRYVKTDSSEIADRNVLTIAAMEVNGNIRSAILEYNNSQNENMVNLIDYSQAQDPMAKFSADVSTGAVPDLYAIGPYFGDMSFGECIAKGMFEDLTPYLEKDKELSPDDFIPAAYNTMLVNGKLYFTCTDMMCNTVIGKKSDVGAETGWDTAQMKDFVLSKSGTRVFWSNKKDDMLNTFVWGCANDLIDWEKGECYFESQKFKDIMEMCNTGSNEQMNYDSVSSDIEELENGSQLLIAPYLSAKDFAFYNNALGDEMAVKGYPSDKKAGGAFVINSGVAISSQSENKEAAWDFVRYLLTEECQSKTYMKASGFPIREDVFEAYIELSKCTEAGTDKYGNEISPEMAYSSVSFADSQKTLNDDDEKGFRALIDGSSGIYGCDPKVWKIISEDAASYFSGDKSLDETCSIIQDRVTTYINECK